MVTILFVVPFVRNAFRNGNFDDELKYAPIVLIY